MEKEQPQNLPETQVLEGIEIPEQLTGVYRIAVEALDALERAAGIKLDPDIRIGFAEDVAGLQEIDEVISNFLSYFNQIVEENDLEGSIDAGDLLRGLDLLEPGNESDI